MAKNKGGRPTKYKEEMCDIVIECGKQGMSRHEMALQLGIHYDTLVEWEKVKPEFSDALKISKAYSQAWWEKLGRDGACGINPNVNSTMWIFNVKNRFSSDWKDKQEVEQSGSVNVNHFFASLDDEEE